MASESQRDRVLSMLQEAGPQGCTTADFLEAYIPRFSARVGELRAAGHSISTQPIRQGSYRYTLDPLASNDGSSPNAPSLPGSALDTPPSPVASGAGGDSSDVLFDVDQGPVSAITGRPVPLHGGSGKAGGTGDGVQQHDRLEKDRLPGRDQADRGREFRRRASVG